MKSKFWVSFFQGLSHLDTKKQSDLETLQGDWQKIGGDFSVAINKIQQSIR